MKDLIYIYSGVYASLLTSNFHTIISNILAIVTIAYTLFRFYIIYKNYKKNGNFN